MASEEPRPIERQWTPVEIAHVLKKDVKTVRSWLADGDHPLVGRKVMNSWYVNESDFKKFLKGES